MTDDLKKEGDQLAEVAEEKIKMPPELTKRQRKIVKYKLRGLTQTQMADIFQVSQPMIAKEMRKIREVFAKHGKDIDQDVMVGESLNLFQEVEQRAWSLYDKVSNKDSKNFSVGDANKALNTAMTAREKTLKILMDLGLIKKAPTTHKHEMELPPFLKQWQNQSEEDKNIVVEEVVSKHLSDLEEPEPPQLPEEIEDAEFEEEDTENE